MATLDELMAKLPVSTDYAVAKPKSVEELMSDIGLKAKSFFPDYTRTNEVSKQMSVIEYNAKKAREKESLKQNIIDTTKYDINKKSSFLTGMEYVGNKIAQGITDFNPFTWYDAVFASMSLVASGITNAISENVFKSDFRIEPKTYTKASSDVAWTVANALGIKKPETESIKNAELKAIADDYLAGENVFKGIWDRARSQFQWNTDQIDAEVAPVFKVTGDVFGSVPQLLPMLVGGEFGYALSSFSNAINNAGKEGVINPKKAEENLYQSFIDVGTESIFGLFKNSSAIVKTELGKLAEKETIPTVAQVIWGFIKQAGEEGAEELIAFPFSQVIDWWYNNKDVPISKYFDKEGIKRWGYSGLIGTLAGGLMSIPSLYSELKLSSSEKTKLKDTVDTVLNEPETEVTPKQVETIISLVAKGTDGDIKTAVNTASQNVPVSSIEQQIQDIKTLGSDIQQSVAQDAIPSTINAENQLVLREGQNINISKTPIEQKPQYTELMRNNINNINKQVVDDIKNGNTVLPNGNITLQVRDGELMLINHFAARDYYSSTENAVRGLSKFYLDYNLPEQSKKMDALYAKLQNINVDNLTPSEVIQKLKPIWNAVSSANAYVEPKKRAVTPQKAQEGVSVSKVSKVPSEKEMDVKTARSASIADIVSKRQRGQDIDKDLDDWLKYSEEAIDIRSIENEDDYTKKVSELNEELNSPLLTQERLDKILLQLFALKKWEDRIAQNIKGKRISLYVQHMTEALRAGKLESVRNEIEANLKDSDLFHFILGNERTIETARNKVEKGKDRYLSELERKFKADANYIPSPDELVAISMYCKKLLEEDNIIRAEQLAVDVGKRLTKAGQTIQSASLLKRVFPEYQAERLIKEVQKTVPFEDKRILDNDTNDTADILGKHRKDAVKDTVDEVTKEQKPKTVAEKLLDSIMRKTKIHEKYLASEETDSTRLLTEEQRLLKALFRKFQSELPKRETKVQNRVYGFIQDIILNRDLYSRTWEEAQRIGKERPEIVNSDTYGFLEMLTDPIVAKSLFKTAIAQKLSDMKESLNTRAKEYFLVGNESYNQFVEMLAQDMPYLDAWGKKYLHEYMRETFDTMMNNKRYQAMQSLKNKVEARKKLKKQVETQDIIVGKLMDIAYKDGFSISEIRSEWAKRMGITDISDTMKQDIYQTMRDMAKEKDENIKDELYDAMVSRISKQIVATPYEKAVAIIRFSLLMRPQTLLRNMLSNFAFMPQYRAGSMLANKIMRMNNVNQEDLISSEKYKKFNPDTELGKLVLKETEYKEIERYLEKTEKYDMKTMFNKDKTYFKNNTLDEVINKSIGNVLTEGKIGKFQFKPLGDIYMYTRHFREAMYNKLMALGYNEILPEETKTDMINKAKEYANQYATRGVFREMNLMTAFVKNIMTFNWKRISTLRNAGKYAEARNLERAQNAFRYIVQSVYRFVVTPAAIGAEVYRFSPFALASSIAFDYFGAKAKGTWAESEQRAIFSRKLADATTGTLSTFALGMLMSFLGLVNAEAPDDEKEKRMWELEGRKAWSIYIPGVGSISIDWLQPIAGPFMIGASIFNSFKNNGFSYDAVKKIADGSIDVLINLSLINNIKQTFGDKYATTTDTIEDFMLNTAYQFIPRLLIDFNKILDPYVRDVYSGNTIQNIYYKLLSAIPGASYLIPAKTDVWGNPIRNTRSEGVVGVAERFMLNLMSPFTVSTANMDSVTKEVIRVFNETGLKEGLPTVPDKVIKYPKSEGREAFEYTLTPDEYEAFRTAVGNLYYNKMKAYINGTNYKWTSNGDPVSDTTHSKNFKKLYDKAREEIVSQFIKKNPK